MKSSQFKRNNSNIRVLKEGTKKKKVNWDKVIYLTILFVSLFLLTSYFFKKIYYIKAEGQVLFETLDVQLTNDVELKKIYIEEGDTIQVGDTLFSYVDEKSLESLGAANNVRNTINQHDWKAKELMRIEEEIGLKKIERIRNINLLKELEKEQRRIENEVYLDVYTADKLDPYIKQINDLRIRLQALNTEIKFLNNSAERINEFTDEKTIFSQNLLLGKMASNNGNNAKLEDYYISPQKGFVTHLFKKENEAVLESEHILAIHIPNDKVFVKAFFEQEDMKYLHVNDRVKVKFTNGFESNGIIKCFYFDTYDLPIHFKKAEEDFHRDIEADVIPENPADMQLWKNNMKLGVEVIKQRYF